MAVRNAVTLLCVCSNRRMKLRHETTAVVHGESHRVADRIAFCSENNSLNTESTIPSFALVYFLNRTSDFPLNPMALNPMVNRVRRGVLLNATRIRIVPLIHIFLIQSSRKMLEIHPVVNRIDPQVFNILDTMKC